MSGRAIYKGTPAVGMFSLDVSKWPAGIYSVLLIDSKGEMLKGKFVVEK